MIIEAPGFLPGVSGFLNLGFLASLSGRASIDDVREAMALVGLDPQNRKHVGKCSLGMRQRLGIAQAIMEDPKLPVLDEPLSGLDRAGVEKVRALLLRFKEQGKTLPIASHNAEDIEVLCDTVHEMEDGVLQPCR